MHKKIIYRSVLILTLVLSCSCNKYLTLYPQNGTIRQQFWQNKEQTLSALIGVYSSLIQGTPGKAADRQFAETVFKWGELRADNTTTNYIVAGTASDDINLINSNILPTNTNAQWYGLYRTINLCNTFLLYAPAVVNIDPTFTQAQLNSYMAEALTIRSLMYFYLVRTFGDVPLKITPTSTDNDLAQLATTPQATIIKQILSDLAIAEQNIAVNYDSPTAKNIPYDKGRITKFAVNALQADIYLWTYDYANCITACNKIIGSGQFGLVAGDGNFFNTVYANGNSSESIFELQYDPSSTQVNPFYSMFYTGSLSALIAQNTVRGVLFPVDLNNDKNVDVRAAIAANSGTNAIAKWIGTPNSTAILSATTTFRHWIIYRYAEILLFKAEAEAFTGAGADALSLVQQVQRRANNIYDPTLSLPFPNDPTDATAVSNYVLDERDREFIYEGKRWYDLVRYAKRNFPTTLSILTNAIAVNASPSLQQILISKFRDPNSLYLPIYYTELQLDPNLVQNPYYK